MGATRSAVRGPHVVLLAGVLFASTVLTVLADDQRDQVLIEARIVTVSKTDGREIGIDLVGSTWGKSQPRVGEHVWEGTDEVFSFLVAKADAPVFQTALDRGSAFEVWRIALRDGSRHRDCTITAPQIAAVHERAAAVLVVSTGEAACEAD